MYTLSHVLEPSRSPHPAGASSPGPSEPRPTGSARPGYEGPSSRRDGGARRPRSPLGATTITRPQAQHALTPGQLTIASRVEADEVTLTVCGEIDLASAPALEGAFRDAERSRPSRIVLDLAALDFIDSTGIHLLIHAQQRADAEGRQLVLTHVPAHTQRLFRLTGLSASLTVE